MIDILNKLSVKTTTIIALLLLIVDGCSTNIPAKATQTQKQKTIQSPQNPTTFNKPNLQQLIPTNWLELPGFAQDNLTEAWNAWLQNCKTPNSPAFCQDVRALSIANEQQKRTWLMNNFKPYKIRTKNNTTKGLLTAYYEPVLNAKRIADKEYDIPIYSPPNSLKQDKQWYSRDEIDNNPRVKKLLQNKVIAYVNDPVMAMKLHIQGSGRLNIIEPDNSIKHIRVAYAASNNHKYNSIATVLYQKQHIANTSWQAVHDWGETAPRRLVKQMLANNPRYIFFDEQALYGADIHLGPTGAQGVVLTPYRSIAVDPENIPYGSIVWLNSKGPSGTISRLVFAQDTGSAIRGAIRADYFVGWEDNAEQYASTMKQDLWMWLILPK